MGSSASKGARTASASIRKYPTRPPPSTTHPPAASSPPQPAPTRTSAHSPAQVRGSKAEGKSIPPQCSTLVLTLLAFDSDVRDPGFASRLNTLGAVEPNPHYSPSSTSSFDPKRIESSALPSDMMTELPRSAFPDPRDNPALRVLKARQRIQTEGEEELTQIGRRSFQGRKYVDAGTIQLALMRRQRGEPDSRIEESLGLEPRRLRALGIPGRGMLQSV